MKKLGLVILGIIALVVYLNIGYLVAYSFDSTVSQTAISKAVHKTIDFMNFIGMDKSYKEFDAAQALTYLCVIILWPVLVLFFFVINLVVLLWTVLLWLVTGGVFRWLDWIK